MPQVIVVANIVAKVEQADVLKAELQKLVASTPDEDGCLKYELYQDNQNPIHFMVYQHWESHKHWQTHLNGQHAKDFRAAVEDAVEGFIVNEFSAIHNVGMEE